MARTMRMPGEAELPPGTVRDFVGLLFFFYRQAHRPTLREISDWIEKSGLPGTASTETIRKMLRGMTVPAHWETVRAVLEALSGLAGTGADSRLIYEDADGTRSSHLERLWHRALDEPDALYRQAEHDPWADDGTGGYSDEPPFLPETAP